MHEVRLTSAARVLGISEGQAAELMDNPQPGYTVETQDGRAYLWKNNELLADAKL